MFIKQQNPSASKENKVRVLFQIHIDQTIPPIVPYANIGSMSDFVHEKEYLISMSSVYRIDKIEQFSGIPSTWLVQLTLIGKNDLQYNNPTQCIQKEQLEEINLVELGHTIKDRLYQFKSADKLFKQALKTNKQEFRAIILHYNMAIIYDTLGEYQKSIDEYQYVLTIARNSIPTSYQNDDVCLVPVYSNIALTYEQDHKFTHAITHAFRAVAILAKAQINSLLKNELESSCYYNLGLIHDHEGKVSDAQNFYKQALKIRQEYLPLGHSDITVLQRLITLHSTKQGDSD
jgi:tetratricopeptide (TPR) repeat protein